MRGKPNLYQVLTFIIFFFAFFSKISISENTLSSTQSLTITDNQTLVSSNDVFELGFFEPGGSGRWYLGIWFKNLPKKTYVWVANRDNPLTNQSGTLRISNNNIVLVDQPGNFVWSSNKTKEAKNPVAELLDNGNFVFRESEKDDPEDYLWQSFDYPTDTLLPGMKLGWDLNTGFDRYITSWKNQEDPSTGDFSFKLNFSGFPEIFLWNGQSKRYRSGPWNGIRFSGVPEMKTLNYMTFNFTTNKDEVSYSFNVTSSETYSRLTVSPTGYLQRFTWIQENQDWSQFWYAPKDQCDDYRECGPYGVCDTDTSPVCNCIKGFEPRNPQAWTLRDGSSGCMRKTRLDCGKDKFLRLRNMKLPESTTSFVDREIGLKGCEAMCLRNCNCTAYSNTDIRNGGSGCVIWTGELTDLRVYAGGGQDLYVRLAASDLDGGGNLNAIIIGITVSVGTFLVGFIIFCLWKRRRILRKIKARPEPRAYPERSQDLLINEVVISSNREHSAENNTDELELPLLDFDSIATATDNFSDANKLGQGGFGKVFKGTLHDGQDIAVKRLSKTSVQGIEEFKNEVRLIARLQHRNLVRLLGCCVEMDEKILIYEYMENRSLDSNLFNKSRSSLLNWQRRFNIICGIARGLLYLHQDSRFRIIHRDLKASNILLDKNMNPKISDFGMARIFGGDETEGNTKRVVGTYGYMSPEYAMDGVFSVKSDVFSFGVLVLEIVSGRRNRGFYSANHELNLLGYAWRYWKEGKGLEIVDPTVGETYPAHELLRCIQVGLLCVQERAEDRPTMSSAVLMLSSETAPMAQPKTPGYCIGKSPMETDSSSSRQQDESWTVNQLTVTVIDAR